MSGKGIERAERAYSLERELRYSEMVNDPNFRVMGFTLNDLAELRRALDRWAFRLCDVEPALRRAYEHDPATAWRTHFGILAELVSGGTDRA